MRFQSKTYRYIKDLNCGDRIRINKIQAIRNSSKEKGIEECTFKPKVNKQKDMSSLRTSTSMGQLQTANSVQKYVYRMNKLREDKEMKQVEADKKTGSGK